MLNLIYYLCGNDNSATFQVEEGSSCGLDHKHITIKNDDSRVMLQTVASLMSVIDDTS
jgi:hypothetical protein